MKHGIPSKVILLTIAFVMRGSTQPQDLSFFKNSSSGQTHPVTKYTLSAYKNDIKISDPIADSLESKIDTIFREWQYPRSPGGVIAIVNKGRFIFTKGYGCANLETKTGMTQSTSFYLASISKQFTGYCIAKLINEGKLTLDDDIRKYIPEMQYSKKTIKVRDLVYQKSGLRDLYGLWPLTGFYLNSYLSNNDVMKILYKQKDLNFIPGEEWEYSNTNYLLLAELVKRITGESIRKWAKKNVFEPLHMENTFFADSIETLIPNRANSYHQNKDGSFSNDPFLDVTVGHTGLYSTAEDMSKWLIHFHDMSQRKDPILTIMLQTDTLNNGNEITNYSFGLFKTYSKALNYWHRGSLFGFKSIITYYPEKDFGLVIMGNVQTYNRRKYAREVTRLFYPDIAPDDPVSGFRSIINDSLKKTNIHIDSQILRRYEGNYVVDSMTVYKVELHNNSLVLSEVSGSSETNLIPIANNQFRNDEGALLIMFSENSEGTVNKMIYQESNAKYEGEKEKKLSSAQEHEITGDYYNDELDIFIKITETTKGLVASNLMLGKIDLYPTYENQLRCDHDFFSNIILIRNSNKKIEGFLMNGFAVRKMEFKKIL
jgi:CubicO group peptidase (beta-lactamase class C family)